MENILMVKKRRKGKEFNAEGELLFEGEYLDEIKIKGKEYNKDGTIVFEVEFSEKDGKEKEKNIIMKVI